MNSIVDEESVDFDAKFLVVFFSIFSTILLILYPEVDTWLYFYLLET